MRKVSVPILATWLVAGLAATPAWPSVFLSELCDPRNNYQTDRFIEIYNSGPDTVDVTNWKIIAVANNVDANTGTFPARWPPARRRLPGARPRSPSSPFTGQAPPG